MKISERIRELRTRAGLKQIDLANTLGVTPQAVSKWERNENFPDIFLIKKIACLFDVSLDDLLGVNEESRDEFEATVFCSSLNRFAERGTRLSAKQLAQWADIIFHHMTTVVLKHMGVPIKYTGDGFLCFFSGIRHCQRALKASAEILRINHDKDIIISLHAGDIYFGLIGHPDYASKDIYGDTVNKSFLIMDAFARTVTRGLVITGEVHDRLPAKRGFKPLPSLEIGRLPEKTVVYQLQ